MQLYRRVVSAFLGLVLACGLTVALSSTASGVTPAERCATATAAQSAAQQSYNDRAAALAKAKQKVKRLAAKLRTAKANHAQAKVKVLKKKLKKAKKVRNQRRARVVAARAKLNSAKQSRTTACSQQTGDPLSDDQLKQLLDLLKNAGSAGAFSPDQVLALLTLLFPSEVGGLDPAQLDQILDTLNALDPSQLQDLGALFEGFGGVLTPTQLTDLIATVTSQFGGGLPAGGFSPTEMTALISTLVPALSSQLDAIGLADSGQVLQLLLTALAGGDLDTLDLEGLTGLLDELVPGVSDQLSASQLNALLAQVNSGSGSLDPTSLANLLGSGFTPTEIEALIAGTAGQALLADVVGQLLPQLAGLGGGGFTLPTDPADILAILSDVSTLLDTLLGGVVCDLLPILCP